jgi:hypothetical protein
MVKEEPLTTIANTNSDLLSHAENEPARLENSLDEAKESNDIRKKKKTILCVKKLTDANVVLLDILPLEVLEIIVDYLCIDKDCWTFGSSSTYHLNVVLGCLRRQNVKVSVKCKTNNYPIKYIRMILKNLTIDDSLTKNQSKLLEHVHNSSDSEHCKYIQSVQGLQITLAKIVENPTLTLASDEDWADLVKAVSTHLPLSKSASSLRIRWNKEVDHDEWRRYEKDFKVIKAACIKFKDISVKWNNADIHWRHSGHNLSSWHNASRRLSHYMITSRNI